MYSQPNKNVTMIEDLPELEDLEMSNNFSHPSAGIDEKYKKYIKKSMGDPHPNSGMFSQKYTPINEAFQQENNIQEQYHNIHGNHGNDDTIQTPHIKDEPTCIDVAEHIANCPICSKFYKNDNSIYIITIIVLAIICILLLRKVLGL